MHPPCFDALRPPSSRRRAGLCFASALLALTATVSAEARAELPAPLRAAAKLAVPADIVVLGRDLEVLGAAERARLERLRGVAAVDRYLDDEPDPGTVYGWLEQWGKALRPSGGPTPFAASAGYGASGPWLRAWITAEAGVLDRLMTLLPEDLELRREKDRLVGTFEAIEVVVRFEGSTLALSAGDLPKTPAAPGFTLPDTMRSPAPETDLLVSYDGTGRLGAFLRSEAKDTTDGLLAGIRGMTLSYGRADAKTRWLELLIDHPQLGMLSPMLAGGLPEQATTPMWGPEVTASFELALPAGLLQQGLLALDNIPKPLRAVLPDLNGRLSLAAFDGLADWGLAFGFTSPEVAAEAAPAVRDSLTELSPSMASAWAELAPGQLALRRFPEDPGLGLVAAGEHLVLLSQPRRELAPAKSDLLTPKMQALLSSRSLLSGYFRASEDGSLSELYGWVTSIVGWSAVPFMESLAEELPGNLLLTLLDSADAQQLARAQGFFLYDLGFNLQVGGNFLALELVSSEL